MCIDFSRRKAKQSNQNPLGRKKTKTKPNINIAVDSSYHPTTIIANNLTNAKLEVNNRKINPQQFSF